MAKRVVLDVRPNKRHGGWDVVQRGGGAVTRTDTKARAIRAAKQLAKAAGLARVVIRNRDGEVRTEYTYGRQP